jgi:hypothetical protein
MGYLNIPSSVIQVLIEVINFSSFSKVQYQKLLNFQQNVEIVSLFQII